MKRQYEALTELGIPVVVMEPLRGGRLAELSQASSKILKDAQPDWSIPSWAFRWLMRLPNVQVILSGMLADMLGQTVAVYRNADTLPARAIAAAALIGQGKLRQYEDFTQALAAEGEAVRYCPNAEHTRLYDRSYARYLRLYPMGLPCWIRRTAR